MKKRKCECNCCARERKYVYVVIGVFDDGKVKAQPCRAGNELELVEEWKRRVSNCVVFREVKAVVEFECDAHLKEMLAGTSLVSQQLALLLVEVYVSGQTSTVLTRSPALVQKLNQT